MIELLKDEKITFLEKVLIVLGEKWCWALISVLFLLVLVTVVVMLATRKNNVQIVYIQVYREDWGAEPHKGFIPELSLPVERIIVTQTADQDETCYSLVSS